MGKEVVIKVERLYDYQIIMAIMSAMWSDIAEDGADTYSPDILTEYWLGLYVDDQIIGMYRIHQLTSVCWQGHVFMLKDHRNHALIAGQEVMRWCHDKIIGMEKIIVQIPECFKKVIEFVLALGFDQQGYNSNSYKKNGLIGLYEYGITKEKMGDLWLQQRR